MHRFFLLLIFATTFSSAFAQDSVKLLIVYPDSFHQSVKAYAELRSQKVETKILPLSKAGTFPGEREVRAVIQKYHAEYSFNHLLLIGSASNFPFHLSENGTYTDHFYSHLDDDGIPDVAVGRIPANNQKELRSYMMKVESAQNNLSSEIPAGMVLTGTSEADNQIGQKVKNWMLKRDFEMKKSMNSVSKISEDSSNSLLIFQIGQGTATAWSDIQQPFTIHDAESYIYPNLTFVISVACSTAGLQFPNNLASTLLFNQKSGVISYFGCTGNCLIKWTDNLGFYLLQASTATATNGTAMLEALKVFSSLSVMATPFEKKHTMNQMILLGDPSLPFSHQIRPEK